MAQYELARIKDYEAFLTEAANAEEAVDNFGRDLGQVLSLSAGTEEGTQDEEFTLRIFSPYAKAWGIKRTPVYVLAKTRE